MFTKQLKVAFIVKIPIHRPPRQLFHEILTQSGLRPSMR